MDGYDEYVYNFKARKGRVEKSYPIVLIIYINAWGFNTRFVKLLNMFYFMYILRGEFEG